MIFLFHRLLDPAVCDYCFLDWLQLAEPVYCLAGGLTHKTIFVAISLAGFQRVSGNRITEVPQGQRSGPAHQESIVGLQQI